jgi:RNA polymerase sigma-70 factor (ECF subfamily)
MVNLDNAAPTSGRPALCLRGAWFVTEPIVPQNRGPSPSTSASLLDLARARNDDAWEQIVLLYSPLVYRWCRRKGVAEADSLDIGQEVFRSVYASLDSFERARTGHSFRAWLKTITANKIIDHHRARNRQPAAAGGTDANEFLDQASADLARHDDEQSEDESERILILRRCLDVVRGEFEPRTWDAFWKVVIEENEPAEVARSLGISRNAVYLAKSRVLSRLTELFDQLVEDLSTLH